MSEYPNPDVLVDVEWLKEHLHDPETRILDVRASDPRLPMGYRMGHIPGAVPLDPTQEFFVNVNGAPGLAPPTKIAQVLGARGISNASTVVVYDEWTGQLAALTFWVFKYVGHPRVAILHGGWAAWCNGGAPTTREVTSHPRAEYQPQADENARATAEWIQANVSRPDFLLLDVRTPDEYRMGHIPGAVNLPYDATLDPSTNTFKHPDAVRAQLHTIGATPEKEIVAYCAAGARSAHMFLALKLLGYPRVRNYDGSMTDWYHLRRLPVQ